MSTYHDTHYMSTYHDRHYMSTYHELSISFSIKLCQHLENNSPSLLPPLVHSKQFPP